MKDCSADEKIALARRLLRTDLFFLIWYGLGRKDVFRQWLLDRCLEVQAAPNGYLDLWAREHYKSSIITLGRTIQDVLASHGDEPLEEWHGIEPTFGIFSHTRPISKGFLRQIKQELETNRLLQSVFPDVLYNEPKRQAPKWSEDDGIVCRRRGNPKESTIEAWGLVDGQPTSRHFFGLIYDDVVTLDSVRSPDAIKKTTEALKMSYNLGVAGGFRRFIGTRYRFNDTYRTVLDDGTAKPRIHAATADGTIDGIPVLMPAEVLAEKRRDMGPYIYASQMLQNPTADSVQGFKMDWLRYWQTEPRGTNKAIVVDPANEKKKDSDYTTMWVIGLGADQNYYIHDLYRDRLSLTERSDLLFKLHRQWKPLWVGYEKYGMQADGEHIRFRMEQENYRFTITDLGGQVSKYDRIRQLVPVFEAGRIWLPKSLIKRDYQGRMQNVVEIFIKDEYEPFPVGLHPDMLDSLARILDPELHVNWPRERKHINMEEIEHEAWA